MVDKEYVWNNVFSETGDIFVMFKRWLYWQNVGQKATGHSTGKYVMNYLLIVVPQIA